MSKWNIAKGVFNWGKSKISPTITSLKGKYNIGSADKIKSKAAKSKLESTKFNLERTFSKVDKSLEKLKKTLKKQKKILDD